MRNAVSGRLLASTAEWEVRNAAAVPEPSVSKRSKASRISWRCSSVSSFLPPLLAVFLAGTFRDCKAHRSRLFPIARWRRRLRCYVGSILLPRDMRARATRQMQRIQGKAHSNSTTEA
jgi:hypothetical protein